MPPRSQQTSTTTAQLSAPGHATPNTTTTLAAPPLTCRASVAGGNWDIVIKVREGEVPVVHVSAVSSTEAAAAETEAPPPGVVGGLRSRNEGCTALARMNAKPIDAMIDYVDATHSYYWNGRKIEGGKVVCGQQVRSISNYVKILFGGDEFNPKLTISRCFESWRTKHAKGECDYPDIFERFEKGELTRESAGDAIIRLWSEGTERGTRVHACLEKHLNMYPDASWRRNSFIGEHTNPEPDLIPYLDQLDEWAKWQGSENLVPIRTELSTVWRDSKGEPVIAGQCDVWMQNTVTGEYIGVDLKCVKSKNLLTASEKPYRSHLRADHPVLEGIADTKHNRYSLQLSFYAEQIANTHGWDIGDRAYILRVHEDRASFQWIKCTNLRKQARAALDLLASL